MKMPGRAFYVIYEAAIRWGCSAADIVEWANLGHMKLVTSVPGILLGGQARSGIMEINPQDLLTAFRRVGEPRASTSIYRMRPIGDDDAAWEFTDPNAPYEVLLGDVLVTRQDAEMFEEAVGLSRTERPSAAVYDWDGMWGFVCRRLLEEGLPENLLELIKEVQDWFMRQTDGVKMPDDSTIRKRLNPLWRSLRDSGV